MSFDSQDPKWTAYVLGELDDDARGEIDQELAQSTEAQRFVDELRRTIDLVSAELQAEPCPTMADVGAGQAQPAMAESEPVESDQAEQFDEWSDVRTELSHSVRPPGHQRTVGRGAVLALAASLLAIVGIGSYLVSPSAWHLRDFRIVWKEAEKANEAIHESASEEEVVLDHSSPDMPLTGPSAELGYTELPSDNLPEVKLEMRDARVIQGTPGQNSTASSAKPASGMGGGMGGGGGGGFFDPHARDPKGGAARAPNSSRPGVVTNADPLKSVGEKGASESDPSRPASETKSRKDIAYTVTKPRYETRSKGYESGDSSGGDGERNQAERPADSEGLITETHGWHDRRGDSNGRPGSDRGRQKGVVDSLEQVESSDLPYDDQPIAYPDKKVWDELSLRRKKFQAQDAKPSGEAKQGTAESAGPPYTASRFGLATPQEPAQQAGSKAGDKPNVMGLAGALHDAPSNAIPGGLYGASATGEDSTSEVAGLNPTVSGARAGGPINPEVLAQLAAKAKVDVRYAQAAAELARAEYEKALSENRTVKGAIPEAEINRLKLTWQKSKLSVERAELERRSLLAESEQPPVDHAAEAYDPVTNNPFLAVADNPLSTFSIDVDTASYSIVRRYLLQNHQLPPPSAVRIEELVNYFHYDYPQPEGDKPFAANVEVAGCPWNAEHRLVRLGIKGREMARDHRPLTNLVFLVDVSGSMQSPDKLPLVKESLRLLAEQVGENDRVAIVVYAGSSGLVLPSTSGTDKPAILKALDSLAAGGSTNGGQGIQLAYDIAVANFVKGGVNRVILATDGDFNVGVTDRGDLVKLIEQKAASGVFLTTLGYGMGNLKDATLEQLADKGNGNYAYIDNLAEAKKVLVEQMSGTLVTIAKDVKIQIEFNPTQVAAFRLIGYENRILRHEDFNNDKKDAGEIGAGHTVTALYELVPAGKEPAAAGGAAPPDVDPLKYQHKLAPTDAAKTAELLTLKLRYKQPDGDKSQLLEYPVKDSGQGYARATGDFKFAASVALFGMLLRDSPYKGTASLAAAHELAQEGRGSDAEGYRSEFIELIDAAKAAAGARD